MNRKTATLILPLAILGFSACSPAQVKQYINATHRRPAPAVVETVPTVAAVTLPGLSVTVTEEQPAAGPDPVPQVLPPTSVQCDDGSFAEQGDCPLALTPANQGIED